MAYSSNPRVQQLMDEAAGLDSSGDNIEEKLQRIAEAVAAEQQRGSEHSGNAVFAPVDPQDAFQCEGCQ